VECTVLADEALEESWKDGGDESGARELAAELDADHTPEPGALPNIGTCRRCGLLIAQDNQGAWSHQPSVGEIEAGHMWIDRHRSTHEG
jgi:hypothetical protein